MSPRRHANRPAVAASRQLRQPAAISGIEPLFHSASDRPCLSTPVDAKKTTCGCCGRVQLGWYDRRERRVRDLSSAGFRIVPTGAVIDSQSVKTTESGGPRGYDAGKKINGRKRHALVDTDGRGLVLEPHPASIQDRDGGGPLLHVSRRSFPFIERVFADGGYAGERVAKATVIAVEIVRKNPDQVGFAVQPRRWVVERFFAWIGRNRQLAKDFEATIASARAFLYAASIMLFVRRIARAP